MFIARNIYGDKICARCGQMCERLTKDHFIPKCCRLTVNEEGNYVGLCSDCNREKADSIVLPEWYTYLSEKQKEHLLHYMRYARHFIFEHCTDEVILQLVQHL